MTAVDFSALGHEYEVMEKIHESGLESIYKIQHRLLEEIRAVRIVLPDPDTDPELMERLRDEARSTVLLRHRNTVELYDFSITPEGQALIVMEYVDGVNLRALREERGPLPISQILEISLQALEALEFLHAAGFVHRNLSPEGIMLTRDLEGRSLVKIIDLGLVKSLQDGQKVNTLEMFLGKPHYAPPEQFSESPIVAQSDLYSFGVLLYELMTGELPIRGEDLFSFVEGHLYQPPRSFAETDPEGRIPEEIRDLVLWTLSKDPADRPRNAEQLAQRLRSFQERWARREEAPAGAPVPEPAPPADDDTMVFGNESANADTGSDPHQTIVLPAESVPAERTATVEADEIRQSLPPEPTISAAELAAAEPEGVDSTSGRGTVTFDIRSEVGELTEGSGTTPQASMVLPTREDPAGRTAPIPVGDAVPPPDSPETEVLAEVPEPGLEYDEPETEPYGFDAVAEPLPEDGPAAEPDGDDPAPEPLPDEEPESESHDDQAAAVPSWTVETQAPEADLQHEPQANEPQANEPLANEPPELPAGEPAYESPSGLRDASGKRPAYRPPLDFQPPPAPPEKAEPEETPRSGAIWLWGISAAALVALVTYFAFKHSSLQQSVPSRVTELVSTGDPELDTPRPGSEPGDDGGRGSSDNATELTKPPEIELGPDSPGIDIGPRSTGAGLEDEFLEGETGDEIPGDVPEDELSGDELGDELEDDAFDPAQPRSDFVLDPRTGLTWLSSDNARDVDWAGAQAFCAANTTGDQTDWRLPTLSELQSIYDQQSQNEMRTRLGIRISDLCVWSSQGRADQAQYFMFQNGESGQLDKSVSDRNRAICVSGG